jgi:hypothetical protein
MQALDLSCTHFVVAFRMQDKTGYMDELPPSSLLIEPPDPKT